METQYKININVTQEMLEMMLAGYQEENYYLYRMPDDYVIKGLYMDPDETRWKSLEGFYQYRDHIGQKVAELHSILEEHYGVDTSTH